MGKANAKKRALNQPLPGMNRTPSTESDTPDSSFARRSAEVSDDDDDDEPPQRITGKKRPAPASRRDQPPRGQRKRTIAESDGEGGDDDNDEDYKEGSDEESEEDEERDEDEGASPSRPLTKAPARGPAKEQQNVAVQNEQDMLDALTRTEAVSKTFYIKSEELAQQLREAGVVDACVFKDLGPFLHPAWASNDAIQLPQLQRECHDREEWLCQKKLKEGKPRDKCKRKAHAKPCKLRAQIFLCWWFNERLLEYAGGKNFPCAKAITDDQRAFSQRRREVSKMARGQKNASASNSNTTLALRGDSDDEDGGGALALAGATVNQRGRPQSGVTMLHKAATNNIKLMEQVQALKGELAASKDELAAANAVVGKRTVELETSKKQISKYQIELKSRGDTALDQSRLRQEQQQGTEAMKRSYAAALLEVCDADTVKRVHALVEAADEERQGTANAPWAKAELDVKAMRDATQVAWEAGAVALRTIAEAKKTEGCVPEKAKETVKGLEEDVVEFQQALRGTGGHTTRALNRIGEVVGKIKKKADKATKRAAKKAAKAAVEAKKAEAAQDSQEEEWAMETAAFAAQGEVQPPEPLEA